MPEAAEIRSTPPTITRFESSALAGPAEGSSKQVDAEMSGMDADTVMREIYDSSKTDSLAESSTGTALSREKARNQ